MPFLALAPVGLRAQDPVLIREVVSREMSIHIGGVETTPQKEIVSRELSFHVENGSSDLVHEVVSREYDVLVDASGTPPAITAVTASLSPTGDSLTLDWSASNPWAVRDIQRFEIYLSDTGPIDGITGLTPHATVGGETTRITLSGLAAYTDHYYAVVAVDGLGNRITTPPARAAYVLMPELVSREMSLFIGQEPEPPFKEVVSREYDLAVVTPEPPPAIADVLMTVSPTGDRVTLDWSSYNQWAVKDIQRFDIYLSDEGSFSTIAGKTPVATAGGGSTSITLTGLTTQRDHHFAVVPVDALGNRIEQVAVSTAYVLMPEIVSREMSLFIGQESEPPYREIVSREMSFVVADGTVPAPVTGIDSGFSAVTSITDEGAVDLDWTAYNELAQRDVSRYRIYVSKNYFDNVTGMNPYQILQDGRQRVTVKGFVGLSIQYFAVVAEDAFGNFDPVVRAFSAQASYAGRPVPLGREYLVNGTAETATTAGWSGQGLVAAAPGSLPGTGLGTRNTLGDFIFAPASGGPLEQILTQRVNLTGVSGLIDAGYQRYSLQALIQSRNAAERAEVELVFRDAVDTVTGRVLLRDDDILSTDWELVEEFGTVPQGSRVVDVILRARRTAGSQTRVGFDNLSFILTNAELLRRVDLDAKVHLPGTPVRLALDPGRYQIRPVQGGRFEAWHGWLGSVGNTGDSGSPDRLDTGWQWSYALASASLPARVVVKSPAAGLFALASRANEVNATAYDFVLREAETLDFYLPHPADSGADNGGGISLIIERLAAQHDAVAHPLGPLAYRSFEDSPFRAVNFAKGRFHLEDAESAPLLAGVAGVTITNNALDGAAYTRRGPGPLTDSVDGDDGVLDGLGTAGGSIAPTVDDGSESSGATITFNRSLLGYLPTHAGIVLTDCSPAQGAVVDFYNEDGLLVATVGPSRVGDDSHQGTAEDDHFFGAVYRGGIASMVIAVPGGSGTMELDHLQFGEAALPDGPAQFEPAYAHDPGLLKAGEARAVVRLVDGRVVVGGCFTTIGNTARTGLAMIGADGAPGTWNVVLEPAPGEGPVVVNALATHNGRLFIGGRFGSVNGAARRNFAAVSLADHDLIDPWNPAPAAEVVALAVDGEALFAATAQAVAKYDLSGGTVEAVDWSGLPAWLADPSHAIRAILPQDGMLYVGGAFSSLQGVGRTGIARIDATTGAVDTGWAATLDPGGTVPAARVRVDGVLADAGGLLVRGEYETLPAATAGFVRKLATADGSPVSGWTPLGGPASAAAAIGAAHLYLTYPDGRIRRHALASGAEDTGWQPAVGGTAQALVVEPERIRLLGGFNEAGGIPALGHATLDPVTAEAVPGTALSAPGEVFAMARQPDGKLLLGGDFQWLRGTPVNQLARLLPGSDRHDTAWLPVFRGGAVRALAIAGDELFVGGDFTTVDGLARSLVKYQLYADGTPIAGWDPGVEAVTALTTSPDHLYVAGVFPPGSGIGALGRVARRGNGGIDTVWAPAITHAAEPVVIHRLLPKGDHLYVGGEFSKVGTVTRAAMARLSLADASNDSYWNPNLFQSGAVASVRDFRFDGRFLYVAGRFESAQGSQQVARLARFAAEAIPTQGILEGALDTSWRPLIAEPLNALLTIDGTLFAAGERLVTVRTDGTGSVRELVAADGPIHALDSDAGRILAGGGFTEFGEVPAGGFGAMPFLGNPRVTFRDGKVFFYPDDTTGPFVGEFEITAITGGTLVDGNGAVLPIGARISAAAGAAGLRWLPDGAGAVPSVSAVSAPPTPLGSPAVGSSTTVLADDPQTPHFRLNVTEENVYEGDLVSVFVRLEGSVAKAGTVGYEILPGTARRYNGITGDYVDAILPLKFETNSNGKFEAAIRVPVIEDEVIEGTEEFYIRLVNPSSGIALGAANQVRVRIIDGGRKAASGLQPSVLNPLGNRPPGPYIPGASNSLTVQVDPPVAGAGWRLRGETQWRDPGTSVANLRDRSPAPATDRNEHWVEFRPLATYQTPPAVELLFASGQSRAIAASYDSLSSTVGTLRVELAPASLAGAALPVGRARWRPLGDPVWHDSGTSLSLPTGTHLIEFQGGIAGWLAPAVRAVTVDAEEDRVARASYAPVPIGSHTPQPLPFTAAPDAPSVTSAPFHCVGRIESSAGSGTGTAVNEQTVVTAAGLLFDKDKLAYADQVSWLHQHDPAVHRASQRVPRALILGGYASQLEVERQTGTGDHPLGSLVSDNLDVGVIYFGGDSAARSGFTGFLADYSPVAGFNPWLLGTTEKILCGYPGVGVSNPGVMHATAASSLPLVTVQHQVFASATFGGLPGMTGAPLFCRHANGSLYPAAIYLGENGGARFRGFDRDVAELIHRADYIAAVLRSAGTGGGEQFTDTLQGDDFPIAMVKVEIPNGMGRWRLAERVPPHEARTVWFQSEERVPVIAGSWDVEFEPLPGFVAPPRQALEVSGGEAPTLIAPTSYSITWESWSETAFTAAERSNPLLSGSAADLDRDGIPNLMEFAFGLPPKLPGRTSFDPGSATPGMPLSQVVRVGGAPRLEISFLRRPADIAPGLTYVVEFADSPAGPWNAAETQTEETSLLNPNWKYVKATESPGSPAGRKFSRVRVEYQPPPL